MLLKEKPTLTSAVKKVFETIPYGETFSGLYIKKRCVALDRSLKDKYEDTFLRTLRKHYRSEFVCISHSKSLYMKVKGKEE